jgi:nucleoid DNA-binding protein
MIQKKVQEIIKKVAKANNITEEEATKIWKSQWAFLKKQLTDTEFGDKVGTIKFPKWGKYYTSEKKLKYIKTYIEKRNARENNNSIEDDLRESDSDN